MAIDTSSGDTGGQRLATASMGENAPTERMLGRGARDHPDHVQELTAVLTQALKQRSKEDSVVVLRMQLRAELYEKAFVQAKQVSIDAAGMDTLPNARQERQIDALHKPDLEVQPPEMIVKLATMDARQYVRLRDPEQRAAAVLALADIARLSVGYRAALASKSPELSAAVEAAITASETNTQGVALPAATDKSGALRSQADVDPSRLTTPPLEPNTLDNLAARRMRDAIAVAEQSGLNGIERVVERKQQARRDAQSEQQAAGANASSARHWTVVPAPPRGENQLSADEVFTASKGDVERIVPAEVEERYLRVGTKFYHPKYTHVVAFEDKGNKLETRSNSEQIAGAMVAIARARGWDEIKVTGTEAFRKEVWLEAAAHGMHVKGYTPNEVDAAELAKRTRQVESKLSSSGVGLHGRQRQVGESSSNNTQPSLVEGSREPSADQTSERTVTPEDVRRAKAFTQQPPMEAVNEHPELISAYAVRASIDKKVAMDGLDPRQRAVVMARVEANIVNGIERGRLPEVRVRDGLETHREHVKDEERT